MTLHQSPFSGEWYGSPSPDQWKRIRLDKEETWKRVGFDPAWFTENIVASKCPQCGAPIYMPRTWEGETPPPASHTCKCHKCIDTSPNLYDPAIGGYRENIMLPIGYSPLEVDMNENPEKYGLPPNKD